MLHPDILDRIQIMWDIQNIDEPTKSDIINYINHGFWQIDSYLLPVLQKTDANIKLTVLLVKKGNDNYVWGLYFNFPGILDDFNVNIDENTPASGLPQAIASLFKKADNALQRKVDKLHDKH